MTCVRASAAGLLAAIAGLLLASLLPAGAALAAEGGGDAAPVIEVTRVDTSGAPEVRLTVSAPATLAGADLPPGAFTVTEDGEERAVRVSRLPGTELQVVLLVDVSGSMTGAPLAAVREAALSFVERMPTGVAISVVGFATEPREASPFSTDPAVAAAAIRGLEAGGRTATYDAVLRGLAQFDVLEAGRRAVVLLSDGEDNQSSAPLGDAVAALARADATLHVVELETRFSDAEALRALAAAGGGTVASIDDPAALRGAYDRVAEKLLGQYLVAYRAEGSGETLVEVAVRHGDARASREVAVELPARTAEPSAAPVPPPETATPVPAGAPGAAVVTPGRMSVFASPWALATGAALVYVALALLLLLLLAPRPARSTLHGAVWADSAGRRRSAGLASMGSWAEERLDRGLERRGLGTRVNRRLERAGILLKPSEAVVVAVAAVLAALALGSLVRGPLLGLPLAGTVALGLRAFLDMRVTRRRSAFSAQLADTLQLLSGSLRAGYGLLQAVDAVSREAESPTAEEFRRLVVETRLGRDLGDALRAMGERMDSDDFAWAVQAIDIHREVGGDLAEVLDGVAETIRAREQIARQVKSLSAEGRLSAKILIGLPLVVMAAMAVLNPGYLQELTGSVPGRAMLGFAGLLMTVGSIWINRLVRIRF